MKLFSDEGKNFFDKKAKVWDHISVHNLEKVRYICELLEICGDDKILDVGTGTGVMIPFYEKFLVEGNVVAVDYSEKMIEVARLKYPEKKHPLVSYVVADVYDLEYVEQFSLVVCYSCFPHFFDKPLALEILSKSLIKGGRLAVVHSDSAIKINQVHENGGVEIGKDSLPSMDCLKEMMRKSGLEVFFERDDEEYFVCLARKV